MTEKKPAKTGNDDILFAAEESTVTETEPSKLPPWKLLIVDDEKDVHNMTKMVLSDYSYKNAGLKFLHAYSGMEAKEVIKDHPDCACVLLDVVMETSHAGLEVARFIRQEAKNSNIRIILRTGQPGKAPEKKIILDYDINDYKEKTELTSQKLFTAITTAIRSFEHLTHLEKQKKEIADKNKRLNEEIARRIVAESNLAKYNKSLEQMIKDKKMRLEEALSALKTAEEELKQSRDHRLMADFTSKAARRLDEPAEEVMNNLTTIEGYRSDMTELIDKYKKLLHLINTSKSLRETNDTRTRIEEIKEFRQTTDMDRILAHYPEIINSSIQGIGLISKTAAEIRRIIQDSNGAPTPLSVKHTIEKALAEVLTIQTRNIDVQTDFEEIPEIEASQGALVNAFKAVLKNSFQAMGPQGFVSISVGRENSDIVVTISDTGKGISEEDLPRVFDPYFSAQKEDATGLGLFVAKSVISNHRGTIEIESTRGEGTTVTITLPSDSPA
ncbi:MAG: response regulator [Desulfobacteraceae bacterium]|nr:response regulator [Desulfobacteraceae bacterium]